MLHSRRWLTHVLVVLTATVIAAVPLAAHHGVALEATAGGSPLVIEAVEGIVPIAAEQVLPATASLPRMAWPADGAFTQPFGPSPYWFEPGIHVGNTVYPHFHTGIDIAVPWGAPVHAAMAGRVEYIGWQGGYGNTVVLVHDGGLRTLYAHLSRATVRQGQAVTQRQEIATAGATGNATGPHLHFEVRPEPLVVSDPMAYLDPAVGGDTKRTPVQWGPAPGATPGR